MRFKDTRGAGSITIEGYELTSDPDGFIEAPLRMEEQLSSHGFIREGAPEYWAWLKTQPAQPAKTRK